jgi:valyl-tRNA synthetase
MVNWCVHCHTALSDLEVEFEDADAFMYNMRYPLKDGGFVEIATTRPETYLADSAVAVNPADERYKALIGKTAVLPVLNREIPVIADAYVDMTFGTGCLKVTPSADPNDFEIGRRHDLPEIQCMDESGVITVPPFAGLDRFEARKKIIEEFSRLGLMGKISPITHSVGRCYRCSSVIEPRVSLQWFVKIKPLAEVAIKAVENGETRIIPKVWQANYFEWMNNIRDWCISRQLWWGHRIPAWHCPCGHITVSEETPEKCEKCGSTAITQETDVLDTWFSSALWPFSTQGWPKENKLLKKFYPTSVLVTAFDILFFWVARMMMFGLKFMGEVPFKDAYIHALIRDEQGQKMSKTKGNSIDPLEMVDTYGADVLRFSLAVFAAQGRDIRISQARIEVYRNFLNKIWNASRFIFMNLDGAQTPDITFIEPRELRDEDRWILTKLEAVYASVEKNITGYFFNEAASALYKFFWDYFCDWYIELIKGRIFKDDGKTAALTTASYVLRKALVALHPFMPFLTEHLWKILTGGKSILTESWGTGKFGFAAEAEKIDKIIEFIGIVRNIRGEYNLNPGKRLDIFVTGAGPEITALIKEKEGIITAIARLNALTFTENYSEKAVAGASAEYTILVPLADLVDIAEETARLTKEREALEKDAVVIITRLKNEGFLAKASPAVVEKDRNKLAELEKQIANVIKAIENATQG